MVLDMKMAGYDGWELWLGNDIAAGFVLGGFGLGYHGWDVLGNRVDIYLVFTFEIKKVFVFG